jgi:hypothetical protein
VMNSSANRKAGYGKYRSSINEQNRVLFPNNTRTLEQKIADFDHAIANITHSLAEQPSPRMEQILRDNLTRLEARRAVAMREQTDHQHALENFYE